MRPARAPAKASLACSGPQLLQPIFYSNLFGEAYQPKDLLDTFSQVHCSHIQSSYSSSNRSSKSFHTKLNYTRIFKYIVLFKT